jgi:hypothetical protein
MNLNMPTASSARPKGASSFGAFERISWRIVAVVIKFHLNASRSHGVDMFAKRPLIVALLSLLDLASSWLGLASSRASDNSKSKIDRTNVTNDAQVMEWKKTGPRTYEFVGMVKVPPNHGQVTAAVNIDGALTFMSPPEVTSSGWPVHATGPAVTADSPFTRSDGVAPEPEAVGTSNGVFSGADATVPVGTSNGVFSGADVAVPVGTSNGVFSGADVTVPVGTSNGVFTGPEPAKGLGGVTPSKGQIAR